MIFLWFLLLFGSLFILLKSADFFVDNAVVFGNKLNIPSFVLGATVIAFGTSLPELAVSISAILKDTPAIISGTVIGSNISNIFFILGTALIISSSFNVKFKENSSPIIILTLTTGITSYFLWDNFYSLTEGVISVILLVLYILYIVFFPPLEDDNDEENEDKFSTKTIVFIFLSGFGIWLGAEYVVRAIKEIAIILNIAEDVISLTVVALGTSLPELAVTIVAVKKKKFAIVLGNVIGSNVFNLLCVLGIPTIVGHFSEHYYKINETIFTGFSIPIMIVATVLLVLLSFIKVKSQIFGVIFLILYSIFIVGTFFKVDLIQWF